MVAPESKTKIKMVRDSIVPKVTEKGELDWNQPVVKAGAIVEADAKAVEELCDVQFDVQPQYRGERMANDPENKNKIFRAVRV